MAGDPHAEYLALVDELTEHDRGYYVEANPTISDVEYDRLSQRLRAIEAEHADWVVEWSPTRRIGHAPVSDFRRSTGRWRCCRSTTRTTRTSSRRSSTAW